MKNIVVVGVGSVGAIVALSFTESKKAQVTCVVRSGYDKISREGYEIQSVDYGHLKGWKPAHIARSIEEAAKAREYDYIVVCTKNVPEVQKIEDTIEPLVHDGVGIILVQNGIGNEEPVAKRYPNAYVMGCIAMIKAASNNGLIEQYTHDEETFGTFDERPEAIAMAKEIAEIYDASQSTGLYTEELQYQRWVKLVYNSTYNTICALTMLDGGRTHFADMCDTVILDAMKEIKAIGEADCGRPLPDDIIEIKLRSNNGTYFEPSMLQDVKKGQPIELEVILGNPLRYAAKYNIPAPTLKVVYLCLRGVQLRLLEKRGAFKLPEVYDYRKDKKIFEGVPWVSGG